MVDEQSVVVVDPSPSELVEEDTVELSVPDAIEIREALAILQENGTWVDDFPFLPDHASALRFSVLRMFADSEVDPKFAIENAEKYIDYIMNGTPKPDEAAPVSPLKRKLKAV